MMTCTRRPICFLLLVATWCLVLPSSTESRSIKKRQSGPHYHVHRQRRYLEETLNRLVLIYEALNINENPQPAFVHVNRNRPTSKSLRSILGRLNASGLTRPDRDISGPVDEAIRRRHHSRVNDENLSQISRVPVGNGLQMRVETLRHSDPLTDAKQTELVRTIIGLCGWVNQRVRGVTITCFQQSVHDGSTNGN